MVAYDFETTNIVEGTPRPLYVTAYSPEFRFECAIKNTLDYPAMLHLRDILVTHFLIEAFHGVKFVAWNGNRFDAYFVAAALIDDDRFIIRPYLTKNKTLRGLRITLAENGDDRNAPAWEFLDGIAMLGLAGISLEKFLKNFAPEHPKLSGVIDFENGETFNAKNSSHREYAIQDSIGLWHAMNNAQQIMLATFNEPLAVTMGGVCIKIFSAHIPRDISIRPLTPETETITRQYALRGGYCYCVKRYHGPVWKYDINQAYAAAMREAFLPCGPLTRGYGIPSHSTPCFLVRVEATKPGNIVPFYHRAEVQGRIKSLFSKDTIPECWITSIEYFQLRREGWSIHCFEHYTWAGTFDMREFVDKLETLRMNAEGGPSGPIGTMVKATGNHAYGKTSEKNDPIEYVLAGECPDDCLPFYADGPDPIEHLFYRFDLEQREKDYHKPQLAAFITAHVRMVLRRAILLRPQSWLYADTDCIVFDSDVTAMLDIHAKRYGAWKIEESGTVYQIIAKKVYAQVAQDGDTSSMKRSAKGMNVRRLSAKDFSRWFDGDAPQQDQIQITNFLALLDGADMYRSQRRSGTRVEVEI